MRGDDFQQEAVAVAVDRVGVRLATVPAHLLLCCPKSGQQQAARKKGQQAQQFSREPG